MSGRREVLARAAGSSPQRFGVTEVLRHDLVEGDQAVDCL